MSPNKVQVKGVTLAASSPIQQSRGQSTSSRLLSFSPTMLNSGLLAYLVHTPRNLIDWNLVTVEAGGFRPLTFLTTPTFHPSQDPPSSAVPALWIIFPPHMLFGTCKELTEFFISPTRTFLLDEDSFISPIPPLGRASFGVNGTMLWTRTNRMTRYPQQ